MSIDTSQFLQTFFDESFEGLDAMESGLLNLDMGAPDAETINTIFRAAHSIKGGSATFGFSDIAAFTHLMETLLDQVREGQREVTGEAVDLMLRAVDCLRDMLSRVGRGEQEQSDCAAALQGQLQTLLDSGAGSSSDEASGKAAAPGAREARRRWLIEFVPDAEFFFTGNDPLHVMRDLAELGDLAVTADLAALPDWEALDPQTSWVRWTLVLDGEVERAPVEEAFLWVEDACQLQIEEQDPPGGSSAVSVVGVQETPMSGELISERRRGGERRKDERRASGPGGVDGASIRVAIDKVDTVINLVGELVITQSMLSTLGEDFDMSRLQRLQTGLAQLERNTRELQEQVMRMRMLPIGFVFNRFPRMVHDVSARLGKQVELSMAGEATELDKTVIEQISDPLVHLVRNALDHGIESPDQRRAAGKPEHGRVSLNAYHKGGNIVIEIGDDGKGMDPSAILAKAVEREVVAPDAQLSIEQIHELIFVPGFSTAETISDVSGRGVGMDVVRRNIQRLGGSIEVVSEPGAGSTFTVRLPLTLAILDGQSVRVGAETYIVPLISIIESLQIRPAQVNQLAGRWETMAWRDDYIPIIRLHEIFDTQTGSRDLDNGLLVVVEGEGRRVGLFVDDLLGQQQVVIKSLEANYTRVEGVSGATILGDGSVALILDIPGLIRQYNQERNLYEYRKRA